MASNLKIRPDLLSDALAIGGERTKTATVNKALEEYVSKRKQRKIISIFGSFDFEAGYNYKKQRLKK